MQNHKVKSKNFTSFKLYIVALHLALYTLHYFATAAASSKRTESILETPSSPMVMP
jgi:hypothetical protein